jgi:hypothetical protein
MSEKEFLEEVEKFVEYDTVKEDWNIYDLEDGVIIKQKNMLTLIIDGGEVTEKGLKRGFATSNILVVFAPREIRGPPDRIYTVPELEKHITQHKIKFSLMHDAGINEYRTGKHKINLQTIVKSIDKTSKFDAKGMPQYIVRFQTQLTMSELEEAKSE